MASLAIVGIQTTLRFVHIYDKINQLCEAQAVFIQGLVATGSMTMPPSPLSTLPAIVSNPGQAHPGQPRLPCIVFLEAHFAHGGVDKKGHDTLYHMIKMISAIGWEVHVMFQSEIVRVGALAQLERYMICILQGCNVFNKSMSTAVEKASHAADVPPDLDGVFGTEQDTRLKQWRWTLRTLHEPTGNNRRLFKLIVKHYDNVAYQRLLQLDRCRPYYRLSHLVTRAVEIWHTLHKLCKLADEADTQVLALESGFQRAIRSLPRDNPGTGQEATAVDQDTSTQTPETLTADVYKPPEKELSTKPHPVLSKSFSAAEEEVARRGHARAATFSEAGYTTTANSAGLVQPNPHRSTQSPGLGSRRRGPGTHVPRIFTGSFSQLESDIRRLQLDKVETPEEQTTLVQDESQEDHVKVRDFGASPCISPCPTPSPGIGMPLQRREALMSKETEIQDRIIRGEVVATRRPSTKGRAQTIDDSTGLEAWLKQESKPKGSKRPATGTQLRNARHRENTL